jgi:uncharacterized protein involved in tolerance to divalent cations
MTVDPLEIPNPIVVQTTVAAEADAQTFARGLVERGFAACVQWTPITSSDHGRQHHLKLQSAKTRLFAEGRRFA